MENLPSEVLIYLQKLKSYFNSVDEVRNYFVGNAHIESFYEKVTKTSQENFQKTGQPMLSVDQFELIRIELLKEHSEQIKQLPKEIFVDYKEFGKFYLN